VFSSSGKAAQAYARVGVETGVVAASPHKLIVMLFDGALLAITNARQQMQTGQIAEKGASISRAIDIVSCGLRASLDKSAGGELAENLDALYGYMISRLLQANLQNDPKALEEVGTLLHDIREAWRQIADDPAVRSHRDQAAQVA
jgi:flagellar protein FliS